MENLSNTEQEAVKAAFRFFEKNPLLYSALAEPLRRGTVRVEYAAEDGVVLRLPEEDTLLVAADPAERATEIVAPYPECKTVCVAGKAAAEVLRKAFGLEESTVCNQALYPRGEKLPLREGLDVRVMTERDLPLMLEHYHLFTDEEYFKELIGRGVMHVLYEDGVPAGFIGMHTEGSMGLLEIFPAFQRRGLATELESFMINFNLERGWMPFCQIILGNDASLNLQKKLGLLLADDYVVWLHR